MDQLIGEIRRVFSAVAGRAIDRELADLHEEAAKGEIPAKLRLLPRDPEACAVTVEVAQEDLVVLLLGPHATVVEVFSEDRSVLLKQLATIVDGVVHGRYREKVKVTDDDPQKAIGKLQVDQREQTYHHNVLFGFLAHGKGWKSCIYPPYETEAKPKP